IVSTCACAEKKSLTNSDTSRWISVGNLSGEIIECLLRVQRTGSTAARTISRPNFVAYSLRTMLDFRRVSATLTLYESGGWGRNWPFFPAVAPSICPILLTIQALPALSGPIIFKPFGVRFGVRSRPLVGGVSRAGVTI